ncbi:MAG: hypothetical protein AB1486_32280 [Planctomycetota bacterium]
MKLGGNLSALQKIGYQANRRLLDVQCTSHDCTIGQDLFNSVIQPVTVKRQRSAALKFGDARVMALMLALCVIRVLGHGFRNRDLREFTAQLLALDPAHTKPGRITYDLLRRRLHGLIERIPKTHAYRVTPAGLRTALFFSRAHQRFFRTGLSLRKPVASSRSGCQSKTLPRTYVAAIRAIDKLLEEANLAA